jgi:PKD repeat protein
MIRRAEAGGEDILMGKMDTSHAASFLVLLLALVFLLQPASAGNTLIVEGRIGAQTVPVADFSAFPTSGPLPLTVQFTDGSTGTIIAWSWEYRRNSGPWKQFATKQSPSFTFSTPGTYDIRLKVTGPGGSDEQVKAGYITVQEPARRPVARFTQDQYTGKAPLTVHFKDRSLNSPDSYSWQFGDGSTSKDQNPSHTYTRAGLFLVRLRVSNSAGSDTAADVVVVLPGWWRWGFPS